jgi:hypothetical protein
MVDMVFGCIRWLACNGHHLHLQPSLRIEYFLLLAYLVFIRIDWINSDCIDIAGK